MKRFRFDLIFYVASYYLGIINLFYFLNRRKQRILNYHHILPDNLIENNLLFNFSHSVSVFKTQMNILSKRFTLTHRFKLQNSAMITFDDGAINNYTYAVPILNEFNVKGYFFIIDERLRNSDLLWVDKWFLWLSKIPYGVYNILGVEIIIANEEDRYVAHNKLWSMLRASYDVDGILKVMNQIYSLNNFQDYIERNDLRFSSVTQKEIDLMIRNGHFIGSHSTKHNIFSLQAKAELTKELTTIITSPIYNTKVFAIPFGTNAEANNEIFSIIVKCGFNTILLNQIESKHPLCFGRINLPNTSNTYMIEAYLSGLHYFIKTRMLL